jgi:hypothetical protein
MKPSQIAILGYAVLYFVLASDMEAGNISQRYPVIYIGLSMLDQTVRVGGAIRLRSTAWNWCLLVRRTFWI